MEISCLRSEEDGEPSQWHNCVQNFLQLRLEKGNGTPCALKVEGPVGCSIRQKSFPPPENLCAATIDEYFDYGGDGRRNARQIKIKSVDEQQSLSDHMLCACINGNATALRTVMDSGRRPDPNKLLHCANNQELTALSVCALVGSWECCAVLLQGGADIGAVDHLGRSALHWAVIAGHAEVVNHLIKEGAPVDVMDLEGFSPLCLAVLSSSKEIVNLILRQNVMLDVPHPPTGATPLMVACGRGDHAVVKAMLKYHANANAKDKLGYTALHYAVWGGNHKCVKAVYSQSSYVLLDVFGRTAFLLAASKGYNELCGYFLSKGSNWNEQDEEGRNCIHWAVLSGMEECVSFLVTHKDIDGRQFLCRQKDIRGSTPLHYAAIKGSTQLLSAIVGRCGEDLSPADDHGWTPLLWAAVCGHTSTASYLLEAKAPLSCLAAMQPLHAAASTGAGEVCKLLVEHGAEVNTRGPHRWTALHFACRFGHKECVSLLLSLGAEVDCLTEDLQTPLHIAALFGHTSILCQLLAAGASKDVTCPPGGDNPAHLAARNGRTSALEALLNNGCGLDSTRTSDGRSLLHLAAMEGHLECCQRLVQRGANISLRDSTMERCTPLDLAMLSSHLSCSVFLMSAHAPSGGGRYHRAALTIQAAWRFTRYKRRRKVALEWAAVVFQRAFRRVCLQRKSRRLRQVRTRARHAAASTIQHHWRGYIREKRRYEATYARLKARLQQERVAAEIILHELNSQTHCVQLPSNATRHKPASSVSKFLLQVAAQPSVAMASGTIIFPKEVLKPDLQRTTPSTRSKTAPPPAVVPVTSEVVRATTAIEGILPGDKEIHGQPHSDNNSSSPKVGHTVQPVKVERTVPSFARCREINPPSKDAAEVTTVTSPSHHVNVVPKPINTSTRQGSRERLPQLPATASLVSATHKVAKSGKTGPKITIRTNQRHFKPLNGHTIAKTRPIGLDTKPSTKAAQTVCSQTSTSPDWKPQSTGGRARNKGNRSINRKGVWNSVEQEVLTTAARYSELNKILCALRQAQASPNLAAELGSSEIKEQLRVTLNEAVRLRADTEVLQNKVNDSSGANLVMS